MRGAAFNWAVSVFCVLGEVQSLPWTHSAGSALGRRRHSAGEVPARLEMREVLETHTDELRGDLVPGHPLPYAHLRVPDFKLK